MNNFIKIFTLVICFATFLTSTSYAQRFGYLNSQNLLADYPEVKNADKELQTYQTKVSKQFEDKAKALEAKFAQYVADMQEGKIPKSAAPATEAALQKERTDILALEQTLAADVTKKRQELLAPILRKVDDAIREVGKENGFQFIFDESIGAILFDANAEDVMPLVKAKLGL